MKKYKVEFTRTTKGYTEVWADDEDHAVRKLIKQPNFGDMLEIENEEFEYGDVTPPLTR